MGRVEDLPLLWRLQSHAFVISINRRLVVLERCKVKIIRTFSITTNSFYLFQCQFSAEMLQGAAESQSA